MSGARWTASRGIRVVWFLPCALVSAACVFVAVLAVVGLARGEGAEGVVLLVLAVVLFYLSARSVLRVQTMGITIDEEEITVDGLLCTRRVPLAEAEHFIVGNRGGRQPMVALLRVGARPIPIWALSRNGFAWQYRRLMAELKPVADELNGRLDEARHGTS
jgi:hypothetical protein